MDRLKESLRNSPIVKKEGYSYFVHPITDGIPKLDPELLQEIVTEIIKKTDTENIEKIVVPEAMGIHIGTAVSLEIDKPLIIIRKKSYNFEEEVSVKQETGYSETDLYVNNIQKGDRVLILDDVVSTGGTMKAITEALENIGAKIIDSIVVIQKGEIPDLPVDVKTLVKVKVENEEVIVDQ